MLWLAHIFSVYILYDMGGAASPPFFYLLNAHCQSRLGLGRKVPCLVGGGYYHSAYVPMFMVSIKTM
jgi:hypothetical protein